MIHSSAPVSVVIPIFGAIDTIIRAVQSVANQTLLPREVILVNDGGGHDVSTQLREIAKEYKKGWIRIIYLSVNVGAGQARNAGWDVATGSFVAFLDSDDAWHPKKIELQYGFMVSNPDIFMSGHHFKQEHGTPSWNSYQISQGYKVLTAQDFLFVNQFITPSVMIRNTLQYQFTKNKRYMEDLELWLTIALHGKKIVKLNAQLACTFKNSFGSSGLSARLLQMEIAELGVYFNACKIKPYLYPLLIFYIPFSLLKFMRRLLISFFC